MRRFASTALIVAAVSGIASAQTTTSVTQGNSTSQSFTISATIGNACVISRPATWAVSAPSTLFWTDTVSQSTSTSFNIRCNTAALYSVSMSANVSLSGPGGSSYSVLTAFDTLGGEDLNGVTSEAGAALDVSVDPPVTAAATLGGQTYNITITFPVPSQSNPAGSYSGSQSVTLNVFAPLPEEPTEEPTEEPQ